MHAHPALNDSALQPAKFSPRKPPDSKPYPIPPRNPWPAHHIHQPASWSMLQFSQHIHYFIRDTTTMQQQALEHAVKERPQHLKQTNVWITQLHLLIQFASQTSNIIFFGLIDQWQWPEDWSGGWVVGTFSPLEMWEIMTWQMSRVNVMLGQCMSLHG